MDSTLEVESIWTLPEGVGCFIFPALAINGVAIRERKKPL